MGSSIIISESEGGGRYPVNDRNSRRNLMESHRTLNVMNVLQSVSNYLFSAPKSSAYNVENTYPGSNSSSIGPRQRDVQRSVSLDRDDELLPFPQRQGSSRTRRHASAAPPPTQIILITDEPMRPIEWIHRSLGDLNLDSGYFDDIDDDDDALVPASVFSRQYGASSSNSSSPVAPVVLQSLPTIQVRYEDLYCLPCPTDPASATPTKKFSDCSICCEAVVVHTTGVRLPCSHIYHPACIDTWLRQNHTCPICRCSLPTLAAFTTPRSILQKRREEEGPAEHELRPIQYTNAEVHAMSIIDLKAIYVQWVTCTYHKTFMSMKIPDDVAEYNKESLIAFLVEKNVVVLKLD